MPCEVPGDLLTCEPLPAKPAGVDLPADHPNTATDADGGAFIVELDGARRDCRAKLSAVAQIIAKCAARK